jgi:hypothetical protein
MYIALQDLLARRTEHAVENAKAALQKADGTL